MLLPHLVDILTSIKHIHHIVPVHAGGTNDPSNLVELTIEEHALAHKLLYEQYGRYQDEVAFKALSGIIPKQDVILELNRRQAQEHQKRRLQEGTHNFLGQSNPIYEMIQQGKHYFQLDENNAKNHAAKRVATGTHNFLGNNYAVKTNAEKLKDGTHPLLKCNQKHVTCPHCGKVGLKGAMRRWHFDKCKMLKQSDGDYAAAPVGNYYD